MLYTDIKYLNLVSHKLEMFKQKDSHRWNFRCPFCGDSKKDKTKARGNVYEKKNDLMYRCFNCQYSCTVGTLIKHLDYNIHSEYILEKYKNNNSSVRVEHLFKKEEPEEIIVDSILDNIKSVDKLDKEHAAVKYVMSRKIPEKLWHRIYYVEGFKKWINTIIPNKFKHPEIDDNRLVFPYFDKHGKVHAVNARALGESEVKYILIKFDDREAVYGLDTVDWSRHIYVTEGQIDSLFIPNCLAVSGSNFDIDTIQKVKTNSTLIFDNEPRNKQISTLIYKCIQSGYNVCMLPETFKYKDINDAIIGGMKIEDIMGVINKNTFSGFQAQIRFLEWKK